jgi:hypothetical protein
VAALPLRRSSLAAQTKYSQPDNNLMTLTYMAIKMAMASKTRDQPLALPRRALIHGFLGGKPAFFCEHTRTDFFGFQLAGLTPSELGSPKNRNRGLTDGFHQFKHSRC